MPFALLVVGAVLLIASVRGTQDDLFKLVKDDFTGSNNFIFWLVSIFAIGALGYVPKLKPFSNALLALVVIVLVVAKGNPNNVGGGFFSQFAKAVNSTTAASSSNATNTSPQSLLNALPTLPSLGGTSATSTIPLPQLGSL